MVGFAVATHRVCLLVGCCAVFFLVAACWYWWGSSQNCIDGIVRCGDLCRLTEGSHRDRWVVVLLELLLVFELCVCWRPMRGERGVNVVLFGASKAASTALLSVSVLHRSNCNCCCCCCRRRRGSGRRSLRYQCRTGSQQHQCPLYVGTNLTRHFHKKYVFARGQQLCFVNCHSTQGSVVHLQTHQNYKHGGREPCPHQRHPGGGRTDKTVVTANVVRYDDAGRSL